MRLDRTRLVLEKFQTVVVKEQLEQDLFAKYSTEYILIVFYSEIEEKIKIIIGNALRASSTPSISIFITNTLDTIIKRLDKKDLCKTLEFFGEEKKELFLKTVSSDDLRNYQNFINNRHNVAHISKTVETSWQEVQDIANVGERILSAFQQAICATFH